MSNIAIIPARGGSKRIPRKNIKDFLGKPIIAYSIEVAIKSGLFDEVMVSTDDNEIAEIAKQYGAKVPFLRSEKNADDYTGPGDVVYEVINEYQNIGIYFDIGCCIYATAPLLESKHLLEGHNLLCSSEFETVFPVVKFSSPIWRSFKIDDNAGVVMNFPEYEIKRSQDLINTYHDAGQFYWFYTSKMLELKNKNIFGVKKGAIVLEEIEIQDIDNIEDWRMAELKAKLLKIKNNI
ncbi:MAG: pseudaminic acid cytidylyltransferase [Bacteroidota bacterium]